ncbi:hypothetical protein MA05_11560 [Comamonas aquatica]|uniref:YgfZ/GcvT domain-containing protein n=1 Tax=Comamonas aquatica TaxID=225991 RepID=UPI0005ED02F7|nr:hypothetical protein [Comamonas aquatica]ANY62609.1 hypothetical protein MA05_11560 [Comamonas aquatica]
MTQTLQGIAPISHLGIIRVQGEDAAQFLHNQLTNDFALLDLQHARLAAFCSAKGRMQASFIGFKRAADDILLVCSRDLLAPTLKRLSMFVLRAKAKLSDASADFQLLGLAGDAVPGGLQAPWSLQTTADGAHIVQLYPAAQQPRALWVAPAATPAPTGAALSAEAWLWSEVFAASDAEQATGTVVQSAPRPDGGWAAIVSMQISAAGEALTAGSASGEALQLQALPYALLEDI